MSIEIDALKYVGIYEEPAGSYQVDHSGTPGDFLALPYQDGKLQAQGGRAMLDPMTGKMRLDGHSKKVLGIRSCTANVGIPLHSHGMDLDGNDAAPTASTWALLRALGAIFGGVSAGAAEAAQTVVVATGTTTTTVELTAGHGDRYVAGSVIGCEVTAGLLELREVASMAGDIATVKEAFSAAPITGSPVRGGVTVYLTEDPDTSLQLLVEGREDTDGAIFRGLQGGVSFELPVGELGTVSLALTGASWARLGSSDVTIPSYSLFAPMALAPLEVRVPTIGSTTLVSTCASAVSIAPAIAYAPQKCGRATETIARMRRQPARPVAAGTFTIPYENDDWFDARDNREDRALFVQVGNLPGACILFAFPTIQITDVQRVAGPDGIASQTVSWEARHDEEIGSTSELSNSAMRIHLC